MCCFFNTQTQKYSFWRSATTRRYLRTVLENNRIDLVVMEACGPSGWITDLCRALGKKSIACSTNEEAWRWRNVKRKTDKDDALKLARLAMLDQLKAVHVPDQPTRQHRTLVKYRKTLDQRIGRVKSAIRSLFANQGIEIPRGAKAWFSGRGELNAHRKPLAECSLDELWRGELDLELTQLDALSEQLKEVEKRLEAIAGEDDRIRRVMTIPGVGRKTAEALVTALDDPHRFDNARQVSAYLGLVPRQYQSGETDRNGRITKRGSSLVRTILLECAWASLKYNPWSRTVFKRIAGGQKNRRKKAAVALARKIAVVAWSMLKHGTDWDPTRLEIDLEPEPDESAGDGPPDSRRWKRVTQRDAGSRASVARRPRTSS
jgi:transposase